MGGYLVTAIGLGSIYALVALGFVAIYRAVGAINFAHGDLVTTGAFAGVWIASDLDLPILVGWLVSVVLLGAVGALLYVLVYRPMRDRPFLPLAIGTLGLGIAIRALLLLIFGPEDRRLESPIGTRSVEILGANVSAHVLLVIVVVVVLVVLQALVFQRTYLGKSLQAAAEDQEVARLLGLPADKLIFGAFVYGCALAGLAGVLLGPISFVNLGVGFSVGFKGMVAAIVGGFGSFGGALIGAFVVAFAETFGAAYISTGYRNAFAFSVLILVLVARPNGIVAAYRQERA